MIKSALLCLVSSGCLATANAETTRNFSVGEAYSINSNELLYRETHCQSDDKLKRDVLYQSPDGESIAHKSIDYGNGFSTPSFKQTNFQTREETEVKVENNIVTLSFTNANRELTKKTIEKNAFSDLPMVIDAGFDAYIRENWDSLVSGEQQQFQFPLVTRSALIELQVSASNCSFESKNSQCFKLEMSNWFYRMLASPIELGYEPSQKRLIRYRGLSNIEGETGTGLDVDIRYYYDDMPLQACQSEGTASHG
ncbi:MAG: hypothetical protein OEY09_04570 [Gammaproteobacteria bacterium]|nr:hypothetical protein [Gammaproteobacteria bacterium]